jgi:hypothetical protein
MTFKIIFAAILIIVRLLIGVRVFSWVILNFFTNVPHPISEIESYLVLMILDIWFSGQPTEITIKKVED